MTKLLGDSTRDIISAELFHEDLKLIFDSEIDIKSYLNHTDIEHLNHVSQILLITARQGNFQLLEMIAKVVEPNEYTLYRIFKERALRNDIKGMRSVCLIFKDMNEILRNSTSAVKAKLAKAMF